MTLRIGAGAGFAGDRIDPARDLAERGALDYLAFECLAERTLAYGHLQRLADPAKGYHLLMEKRLGAVLAACVANRTTIITNMGVANPRDYEDVKASLTVQRLKALHPKLWRGPIERYELPDLHGLNFVFHDALEGGVNASLNLDFHGKSFSYLLLGMTVEVER